MGVLWDRFVANSTLYQLSWGRSMKGFRVRKFNKTAMLIHNDTLLFYKGAIAILELPTSIVNK